MWREATFFVVLSFGEGVGRDKHHTTHARAARPHGQSRPASRVAAWVWAVGLGPHLLIFGEIFLNIFWSIQIFLLNG